MGSRKLEHKSTQKILLLEGSTKAVNRFSNSSMAITVMLLSVMLYSGFQYYDSSDKRSSSDILNQQAAEAIDLFGDSNVSVSRGSEVIKVQLDEDSFRERPIAVDEDKDDLLKFTFDSYSLAESARIKLNGFKRIITERNRLKIIGHADSIGDRIYNANLSQLRAYAVYDFLRENGVSEFSMSIMGLGENSPLKSNSTEDGRSTNRRVELELGFHPMTPREKAQHGTPKYVLRLAQFVEHNPIIVILTFTSVMLTLTSYAFRTMLSIYGFWYRRALKSTSS